MRRSLSRQFVRLLRSVALRALIGPATQHAQRLSVGFVDDPTHPIRLVRVAGVIDAESVDRVLDAWEQLTAPHLVHLDLQDAAIVDVVAMTRLEAALDRLERQRIAVRIVGIDPHHPAIAT